MSSSCCCHVGNRGQYELGQELSFGDALKAHAIPNTHHHQSSSGGITMLSDLIEEQGPLAASAMSSPTHTTTFVLPAQQTSPAQLAGLAPDSHFDPLGYSFGPQQQQQQLSGPPAQQLAWPTTDASVAAGIAAGDLMTFQVDGQIKLGLRPRQLTISGSAQQAQQQQQQPPHLYGSSAALPAAELAPVNPASPHAAADIYQEAGHSELSPVPLLSSRVASNASRAFADMAAADAAAVQTGTASVPAMAPQSGPIADDLQQQDSPVPTVPVSVATTEAVEVQTGQQLTNVAPSLSWPTAAEPSRQSSGVPPPLSHQQSNLSSPLPRQPSAVVKGPVRQTSAVAAAAAPSRLNSSALSRQNSQQQQHQQPVPLFRQVSRLHHSASRLGSGMQMPLSCQASAVATEAAQRSAMAEEPEQAAAKGPGQGLEQAWAALLPSLLASASQQHSDEPAMLPSAALPNVRQQAGNTDAKQQTVGDILKMWAPIARPTAAGNTSSRHDNEFGRLTGSGYWLVNIDVGATAESHDLMCI